MTDTYQTTAASNQRKNLVSASITDNVANWTAHTGTLPAGTYYEQGFASARNIHFGQNSQAGTGDGSVVLSAMIVQNQTGNGVTVYVRKETDFGGFTNISNWTQIWTDANSICSTAAASTSGNNIAVIHHEVTNTWVVAWYAHSTVSGGADYIYAMSSSDGVTWSNMDGAASPQIESFAFTWGSTTAAGMSLALVAKDMTDVGYSGIDLALLILTDMAIVTGEATVNGISTGRQLYVAHHIGSFWDNSVYTWNNGSVYSATDITATYVSSFNQINVLINGSLDPTVFGANHFGLFSSTWNALVAPTNFSRLTEIVGVDVTITSGGPTVHVPFQQPRLTRYIQANDPNTQWLLGIQAVLNNDTGTAVYNRYWSKALEWDRWQDFVSYAATNSTAIGTTFFFDNTNKRYLTFADNTCRNATIGLTADVSSDIISYSRQDSTTGNAGTVSIVINNLDATTGGMAKWYSEGGDPTVTNTNMVTNPSFETNTTGWSGFQATISRDATQGYPSGASLKVQGTGTNGVVAFTNAITLVVGKTYTMQARVKMQNKGTVFYLLAKNNGQSPNFYGTGQWDWVTWTFTCTNATSGFEVHSDTDPNVVYWIDQVMLEQNSTASQYFDGSFAGGQYAWTGTANNSTSTYAANYQPRTGTNASAIKRNSLITLKEGFVTSAGNETVQVGLYYIDDIKLTTSRGSMELTIEARDAMKKLKNFVSTTSLNWYSQIKFYDDFSESTLDSSDWSTQNLNNSGTNSGTWAISSGALQITQQDMSVLTYNSIRPIDNGVVEAKFQLSDYSVGNAFGLAFRLTNDDGVTSWYEMTIGSYSTGGPQAVLESYSTSTGAYTTVAGSSIQTLSNNTWYWARVMFSYNEVWGYFSSDGFNWQTVWSSPVDCRGLAQSDGFVGLVSNTPVEAVAGTQATTKVDYVKVYDLTPDQTIEGVSKTVAAKGGVFQSKFDSTLSSGFQNQLKNPSFEGYADTTTATTFPTTAKDGGEGTVVWSNPGNILASDGAYATATVTTPNTETDTLWAQGFGFNIPSNATIKGVAVDVLRKTSYSPTNLIATASSGFETAGSVGTWVAVDANATISQVTTQHHTGTGSMQVAIPGVGNYTGAKFVGPTPQYLNQYYFLTVFCNVPNGVAYDVGLYNNDGNPAIGRTFMTGTGTWQQVNVSGFSTTTSSTVNIYIRGTGTFTFFVDDVTLSTYYNHDADVQLIKGGVIQETSLMASVSEWPTTAGTFTYGGTTSMWSTPLTPADVNSSSFGVEIAPYIGQVNSPNTVLSVDSISMRITYSLPNQGSTSNWTKTDSNSCVSTFTTDNSTSQTNAGLYSGKVAITAAPTSTASDVKLVQSNLTVHNGVKYIASFYAKADTPRTIELLVMGNGSVVLTSLFVKLSTQWQRFSTSFTASATYTNLADFRFYLNNGSTGTVWIDGAQLESLPSGSTQTSPSDFDDPYGNLGSMIGTGSYLISDGNNYGDALAITSSASSYGYVPWLAPIPVDFRLDFNTQVYQSSSTDGTGGRIVYRSNALGDIENGYVLDFGLPLNSSNWYSSSWQFRKAIVTSGVTGMITHFTMSIDLSVLGNSFWQNVKSDGSDIIITASDGITKFVRQLSNFSKTNKTGTLYWLNTSAVNTGSLTYYIYYGNSAGAEANGTAFYNSSQAGGGFFGVYHLDETTFTTISDSSGIGYNMSGLNTLASAGGVEGKALNTASGSAVSGTVTGAPTNIWSMDCWVYVPSASMNGAFMYETNSASTAGFAMGVGGTTLDNTGNNLIFLAESVNWVNTGVAIGTGWHHVGMGMNAGGVVRVFLDGVAKGNFTTANPTAGNLLAIGADHSGTSRHFTGIVDEARFSNAFFTDDYYKTMYLMTKPVNATVASPSPNNTFWGVNQTQTYTFSDWALKRIDNGIINVMGGANANSFQFSVAKNTSPNIWNSCSLIVQGGWHTLVINNQVVISVYDSTYLSGSTGTGYLMFGAGDSVNYTYFDNIRIPQLWSPVPALTMSPSDDGQQVIDNLLTDAGSSYWITWDGKLKARQLAAADPLVWTFPSSALVENDYDVSDKEFITHALVYGDGSLVGEQNDTTNAIAMGEHRASTDTSQKLTTQEAVDARAQLDLSLAQAYIKQPDPTLIANPGLDAYDVINLTDPRIGLAASNYRVTNITTSFDAKGNTLDQQLGVTKVTGI